MHGLGQRPQTGDACAGQATDARGSSAENASHTSGSHEHVLAKRCRSSRREQSADERQHRETVERPHLQPPARMRHRRNSPDVAAAAGRRRDGTARAARTILHDASGTSSSASPAARRRIDRASMMALRRSAHRRHSSRRSSDSDARSADRDQEALHRGCLQPNRESDSQHPRRFQRNRPNSDIGPTGTRSEPR